MKKALILLCLALPVVTMANEIDNLKTNADVVRFLIKRVDKKLKHTITLTGDTLVNKSEFGHNTFYKLDFDKNGLTDLVVDGAERFVILDMGKDGYVGRNIDRGTFFQDYPSIVAIDSCSELPKIIISHKKYLEAYSGKHVVINDTLVYKFGGLFEYNTDTLKDVDFQKLVFTTTRCFGTCPVFSIEINADKSAVYKAIEFNAKEGSFQENISPAYFKAIISIIKYINPARLDSSYTVSWTDDQTAITEIYFNGGKKRIEDYGEIGRYSLMRLYSILFSLRNKFDSEDD